MGLTLKLPLQHPLEGIKPRKHGKQERVEVACDGSAVLRTGHLDFGVIPDDLPRAGLLLEVDELDGRFDIAGGGSTS